MFSKLCPNLTLIQKPKFPTNINLPTKKQNITKKNKSTKLNLYIFAPSNMSFSPIETIMFVFLIYNFV